MSDKKSIKENISAQISEILVAEGQLPIIDNTNTIIIYLML